MNREIKFRAWNKKRKSMYEVLHLHVATILNGGIWATVKGRDIIEDKDIHIDIQPKDIELMQYTGLKDRNGKEIYEGDILSGMNAGPVAVKWDDKWAAWVVTTRIEHGLSAIPYNDCEVIGNIYENPELLEVPA